jgi:succinate-acetate transporter protein
MVFLPWVGIEAAYAEGATSELEGITALYKALGIFFFCAMIPVFIIFLASFKTAIPVSFAAFCIVVAFILQGSYYLKFPSEAHLMTGAGALAIMVGVTLWYAALSVLLAEEGIKILPVLPLPRMD